jgi:hypothetical protein
MKMNGTVKNNMEPTVLSRNSSDLRGAISMKAPVTRRPAIAKIVKGNFMTSDIFNSHDHILLSISPNLAGFTFGEETILLNAQTKDIL